MEKAVAVEKTGTGFDRGTADHQGAQSERIVPLKAHLGWTWTSSLATHFGALLNRI